MKMYSPKSRRVNVGRMVRYTAMTSPDRIVMIFDKEYLYNLNTPISMVLEHWVKCMRIKHPKTLGTIEFGYDDQKFFGFNEVKVWGEVRFTK